MSWVSETGDLKARALYKVNSEKLENSATAALTYSKRLRDDALV
jgi:hypothetical protein